jgi:hypothetical protein
MSNLKHQNTEELVATLREERSNRQAMENEIEKLELDKRHIDRAIGKITGRINNSRIRSRWADYYLIGGDAP